MPASAPAPGPLSILAAGLGHIRRHPYLSLGIVLLGALLSALGTFLHIRLSLPDDLVTEAALGFAATIPLMLYFVPRFLTRLDAESANHPGNAADRWQENFEARWLKAFGARMLLSLAVGIGITLCFFPGLIVLAVFGWVPLRVLLRGEPLVDAARASMALMARSWPLVLRSVLLFLGAFLLVFSAVVVAVSLLVPNPSLWQRLVHPAIWGGRLVLGLLDLALSACLLALHQAIEPVLERPAAP